MKLFENIAEYQAFMKKYEILGEIQEKEFLADPLGEEYLARMFDFCEFLAKVQRNSSANDDVSDEKLWNRIALQEVLSKVPT